MLDKVLIKNSQIDSFAGQNDYGSVAKILLERQKREWKELSDGYKSLTSVKIQTFQFDDFKIKVQFNPGRIVSSSAKVDRKSISERKCFLCVENLPPEQKGILYKNDFLILCNPFPIFPEHFTLPNLHHTPQQIETSFGSLLSFSRDLSKHYTVFYNGPKCGASAPDHLHFQAGSKFFMPIDAEFYSIKSKYGKTLLESKNLRVSAIDDGLRKFISFEGNNIEELQILFAKFYNIHQTFSTKNEEPMVNIIAFYDNKDENWRILIFLREKHRSSHYFAEGGNNILISPAAVDLGGFCITPLEKDFNKISKENIIEIFKEIFPAKEKFSKIMEKFSDELARK